MRKGAGINQACASQDAASGMSREGCQAGGEGCARLCQAVTSCASHPVPAGAAVAQGEPWRAQLLPEAPAAPEAAPRKGQLCPCFAE